jgi:hypothetical protein
MNKVAQIWADETGQPKRKRPRSAIARFFHSGRLDPEESKKYFDPDDNGPIVELRVRLGRPNLTLQEAMAEGLIKQVPGKRRAARIAAREAREAGTA